MNNHGIPERPLQPPLRLGEMDEDPNLVEKEQQRACFEDHYGRTGNLLDHVRKCVAEHADRIYDNADDVGLVEVQGQGRGYFINEDDFDDLAALIDDMRTIEKEGW